MALAIPASRQNAIETNFSGRPSATWGTGLTANATPHVLDSARTEVIAATTYEAEWVRVTISEMAIAATNTDAMVNIYIGGAGSELLFIDSLLCGWSATAALGGVPIVYWFPVRIPRGTRISATLRSLIASDACRLLVELGVSNGEHWVGSGIETLGEDTAASEGTDVTPGGASEGSYATIGTSGRRYRYIVPGVIGNNDTSLIAGFTAWDIGVGSADYQDLNNWLISDNSSEYQANWLGGRGWWCDIPSGTALQLRSQSHTAASGLQTACLYGVY